MASITGNGGAKRVSSKAARDSPWRFWILEPLLWVLWFLVTFAFAAFGVGLLLQRGVSNVWIAGFVYTAVMPAFLLSPGRGSPGYNPFGPIVRRAFPRLVKVHLVYLAAFLAIVALHEATWPMLPFLHWLSVHHPGLTDFFLIGGPVGLAIAQGVQSYGILEAARQELSQR